MRIIFMGTPDFAVPSLRALADAGITPIAVVTAPDKPRGRGRRLQPTPVAVEAERLRIETILKPSSVKDPEFARDVANLEADIQVIVAFRILPPAVFTAARLGAFNLHGSLLPRFRGAAPIHRAVMAGETETGVTTFFLKEKVDTGNMLIKRSMPIGPDETTGDVHDRMMVLGAEVVVETTKLIASGEAQPKPQDDSEASPAPKVHRETADIPWERPARQVHDHIRGLSPAPCAWTILGDQTLKIYRSRVLDGDARVDLDGESGGGADVDGDPYGDELPGTVLESDSRLIVACGEGAVEVIEIQPPGRRRMLVRDYLNGATLDAGTVLGADAVAGE